MRRGGDTVPAEASAEARQAQFLKDQKERRKRDKIHIKEFIETIQNDKLAYEIFRQEAEASGMTWTSPLKQHQRQFQHQYFKDFIQPQQEEQWRERKRYEQMTQVNTDRNRDLGANATNFIPLSDLLKRNHNDRVKYHLANLEGDGAPGEDATKLAGQRNTVQTKIAYDVQMAQAK